MSRETDLAWAAGIIDGEGHIALAITRPHNSIAYVLRLVVTNTNLLMLERLKEIFGVGYITVRKVYSSHHKQGWQWHAMSKKAEIVLALVEPYLVAKKEHARLGLLSRKYIGKHGTHSRNLDNGKIEELKMQISGMNAGRAVPENLH